MLQPRLMKLAKMRGLVGQNSRHRRGMGPLLRGTALLPSPGIPGLVISGVTKDSTGAALGGCTVELYRLIDDVRVQTILSDGSGNYTFAPVSPGILHYAVAYKAGSPDVAGTTLQTLQGVQP